MTLMQSGRCGVCYLLCAAESIAADDTSHVLTLLHVGIRLHHPVQSRHVQLQDVLQVLFTQHNTEPYHDSFITGTQETTTTSRMYVMR